MLRRRVDLEEDQDRDQALPCVGNSKLTLRSNYQAYSRKVYSTSGEACLRLR